MGYVIDSEGTRGLVRSGIGADHPALPAVIAVSVATGLGLRGAVAPGDSVGVTL